MARSDIEEFLREIEEDMGCLPGDLHVTRMCCALVAVSNGRVVKVTPPRLAYCPLRRYLYMHDEEESPCAEKLVVKGVMQKISQFGHFTIRREICRRDVAVPFGASEMMMYALKRGSVDAAVAVCDGVGTVVTGNPYLVQGIGARMTGLFYTSPIRKVMEEAEKAGGHVVFPDTAEINQIEGLKKAVELGYRRIAVTINGFAGERLEDVRRLEEKLDASVTILTVCTTGVDRERAEEIARYSDLAWGCASLHVREAVGRAAKLQIGVKIPVFILTRKGLDFLSSYASKEFKSHIRGGKYLVTRSTKNIGGIKIEMGDFTAYLQKVESLPVRSKDEPKPLI